MANTVTSSANMRASDSNVTINVANIKQVLTGNVYTQGTIIVGITAENIPMGEVTTPGPAYFRNIGTTNAAEIGKDVAASFEEFAELGTDGEPHVGKLATTVTAPQAKAVAGTTAVEYLIFDRIL